MTSPRRREGSVLGLATSPEISHGWGLSYLSPKLQDNCPVVRFYFGVSQGTRYDLNARSLEFRGQEFRGQTELALSQSIVAAIGSFPLFQRTRGIHRLFERIINSRLCL
jgi:hypothetical protein